MDNCRVSATAFVEIEIRHASSSDACVLLNLIEQHAAFEGGRASCTCDGLFKALLADPPRFHCWIAWDRRRAIGYATAASEFLTWSCSERLHMDCLFVEPDSRGRGIGQLLFEAVREFARERGLSRIEWQTPAWNARAIRFYERLGGIAAPKMRFHLDCSPADYRRL